MNHPPVRPLPTQRAFASLVLAALAGCATVPQITTKAEAPKPAAIGSATPAPAPAPARTAGGPSPAPPASSASAPAPPSAPGTPPTFVSVIRDARRIDGPLTLWQKDDRLWIELMPEQLGKPYLLSPKIRTGVGEGMLLGGLMAFPVSGAGGTQVIEFVRVHNMVRLQARNTDVFATPGTPEARAVQTAFSASLLGSTQVASQPHPDRKSILIDAGSLFLNDLLGVGMQLQRMFRQGYSLERSNTTVTAVRGTSEATVIETLNHYFTGSVSNISFGPFAMPQPQVPSYVPDTRSLMIGHHYSISPLPDKPMPTRRADPRIGHFTYTTLNFSDDLSHTPRQRVIIRWRLEKKDPAAESSEPVKPITFWIDRNVPLQYRDTVREGILEWNKAFERIGFRNAIVVQQQPDDAPFDTLDTGYASVRWMANADPSFTAIGPSHVDPRSGEILDADVAIESTTSRTIRAQRVQVFGSRSRNAEGGVGAEVQLPGVNPLPDFASNPLAGLRAPLHAYCTHGLLAAEQLSYMVDVLDARGEVAPGDMRTQQFVLAHIKDTVMHEIGHALGLRHNFRASRVYTESQLADPEFTKANGTAGSVMDYTPVNLARPGQTGGVPFQTTLGPYDFWAVEYAYRQLPPGTTAEQEEVELLRIASRSAEPELAYGSDEDSFVGLDPETVQWDLGADPLAFASKRLEIARELFKRQETRVLPGDRDYAVLRRSLGFAIGDAFRAVGVLARHIGGVRTLRDYPGSGRDPLQPVSAEIQRAALDLIARNVLSTEGLALSPALQRKLAPDYLERVEFGSATDFAVPQRLLELQRAVLAYLLSDGVAGRILDSVNKFDQPQQAFQLSELYSRLSRDVWSELSAPGAGPAARPAPRGGSSKAEPHLLEGSGAAMSAARRELQRDHANRLAVVLLRPAALQRADARSLMREEASGLLQRIESRLKQRKAMDAESRAHLREIADTLRQALAARVVRTTT